MLNEIYKNKSIFSFLSKDEKLSIVDWLIDNTMFSVEQIAAWCDLDKIWVSRIFNAEIKPVFAPIDPIKNGYIASDLIEFLQQNQIIVKQLNDYVGPLSFVEADEILTEKILKIKLIKTYFLYQGHNAWWNSWSSRYNEDRSIHLTLSSALNEAEKHRTQGRVFTISELPSLCFYCKNRTILFSGINFQEETPYKELFKHDLSSLKDFVNYVNCENINSKYPQFLISATDCCYDLADLESNEEFKRYRSVSEGSERQLKFNPSSSYLNMFFIRKLYDLLRDLLNKEKAIKKKKENIDKNRKQIRKSVKKLTSIKNLNI